ncbi:AAA family ATPase [Pseudomonas syringae]|nr:AAA family ATPase [Pseudomonas syringae]
MNFLIGPNNSGKSRLIRSLFSTRPEDVRIGFGSNFKATFDDLNEIINHINYNQHIYGFNSEAFMSIYRGECKQTSLVFHSIEDFAKIITRASNNTVHPSDENFHVHNAFYKLLQNNNALDKATEIVRLCKVALTLNRHYIPILRGMRPLGEGKDVFLERTLRDYFSESQREDLKIVTGFNLYKLLTQYLLGQPDERDRVREYEKILGNEFFGGAEVTLIPQFEKDTVAVKIGKDRQFPIYDLGDGLQQVIIITSATFLEKNPSVFFIEEPEACLHPGLLRKLALFLLEHTNHQYIVTTHSNHLLDLAENDNEILIHRVSKNSSQQEVGFKIQECTRDREILADLGVRASSVYLANSTIWVEGITDRLYLKTFMKKYLESLDDNRTKKNLESLLENFHYAFVEYQGGTLGHWGFDDGDTTERLNASKLCSAAFLIADGDILGKGERVEVLNTELKDRFHLLPSKEIENLLPLNILMRSAQSIFDRKHKKTIAGLDSSNLRKVLTLDLANSEYGIGHHLDVCLGLGGKGAHNRRVFSDESGTINEKVKFCREAIKIMEDETWEIPKAIRDLCEKIFAHIQFNNHIS